MNDLAKHVYVMQDGNGSVKVGISRSIQRRLDMMSVGRRAISLIWMTPLREDALDVEMIAHTALAEHRTLGEWFSVTPERAIAAVSLAVACADSGDLSTRRRLPSRRRDTLPHDGNLNIRMSDAEMDALKAAAADDERPYSALARRVLLAWLREKGWLKEPKK